MFAIQPLRPGVSPMNFRFSMMASAVLASTSFVALAGPLDSASLLWTQRHGLQGAVAAAPAGFLSEIVTFDRASKTLWVAGVKGVDVLDALTGTRLQFIDTTAFGSINSVAIHNGIAAFAIESSVRTDPGVVKLYDTATRALLSSGINSITVGALPDMLTFTSDGSKLLVANEGTPTAYGAQTSGLGVFPRTFGPAAIDPVGSVSIIDMASRTVFATPNFASAAQSGTHIRTNTGMDFEPEYIAISGNKAYVSLQEANAMGVINLQTGAAEAVIGLGAKNFNAVNNEIDPLNGGGSGTFANYAVKGLYMPDGMASYQRNGVTYVVMANEGDLREDDGDRLTAGTDLGVTGDLSGLRVSATESTASDLYAIGGRSFSIRKADGELVFDSGSTLDRQAALVTPNSIYADGRSPEKGVEPEGVELMTIGDKTFAFVGLERTSQGSVAVFDITDPANASFVKMLVLNGANGTNVLLRPEGLKGFEMDGTYYLAVASEGSNTTNFGTAVFSLAPVPEPGTYALMAAGLLGVAAAARRRRG